MSTQRLRSEWRYTIKCYDPDGLPGSTLERTVIAHNRSEAFEKLLLVHPWLEKGIVDIRRGEVDDMSAQRLSPKTMRRIERNTGLKVVRAWAWGGYNYEFVTPDHRHIVVSQRTWEWEEDDAPQHFNTCSEMFPDFDPWAEWQKRHPGRTPGESVLHFTTTGEVQHPA